MRMTAAAQMALQPSGSSTQRFEDLLRGAQAQAPDVARESAEQLVAITLVQPLLDAAQNDPFASGLFHGGQGERIFQQQINALLGERITKQANFPVVDAVYRAITKQTSGGSAAGAGAAGAGVMPGAVGGLNVRG